MVVVSIKNFVQKAVGQKLKQQIDKNRLDEDDMTAVNRENYYKYLEEKGSDRNSVENEIFNNKRFDLKFRKQIDNLDARYFKSDPKETIMLYYLDYIGMSFHYFYDIQTICRVFRKFDESKKRYSSCDQNDKSMRNVIIYSGNAHTQNINKFLQDLPVMEVNQYTGKLDIGTNVKLLGTPVLCFGKVVFSYDIPGLDDRYKPRQLSDEIEIPSKYDYFDYNKKIIKKLKNHYNVLQYTQLPKAIKKEEEERKMKQQQQQLKRKEERKRKMKQQQQQLKRKEERKRKNKEEEKIRWAQYYKKVQQKNKQMQQRRE